MISEIERGMLGCKCLYWKNLRALPPLKQSETFSLPASIPQWPSGQGFASGRINLGELKVVKITTFEFIWRYRSLRDSKKSVSFYKPEKLPENFHCLGHYCHSDSHLSSGFVLVARQVHDSSEPALVQPLDYTLVWSSNDLSEERQNECNGYFWLPQPPQGYKPIGYLVTTSPEKPELDQVRCVRADLTHKCEAHKLVIAAISDSLSIPLFIWKTRPSDRGMYGKGVSTGSNLPNGGTNDKQFWIDLPRNDQQKTEFLKRGDLESSKLYVHVKPAFGGTFTDFAFWIFCPFNGPATLKLGLMNLALTKTGQHVCDWEHFTLRISNFSGELYSIYFSQHSGGEWIEAKDLEFVEGSNKAVVYSSKHGHASFARSGLYLQGSDKLGIGIRNDTARSDLFVDSSLKYEIVAAEYLGGLVVEPSWLGYMREWGPKIVYDSRSEIERLNERLPLRLRCWVDAVLRKLPVELSGEEGPTGPKEKNNWFGDERW
ncbi:hypothetical protein V5N11_019411 [Cardamine amara subsp. amara]|uniref:Vacuolar protein sorting-associated protein 62 n=1 Tax=Cardamine amara subsp. amara TaxID=228776 RepID=A0ABD1A735_CARAN